MKNLYAIKGNLCGARVRLGRAMHIPPLTQEGLASKIQLMGWEITKMVVSRIERGERHVIDAELRILADALNVSLEWLIEATDIPGRS